MQNETEKLQNKLDEQALIQNIHHLYLQQFQSNPAHEATKGGAVPALEGNNDRAEADDRYSEFLTIAKKLADAQARLSAQQLQVVKLSKPERERMRTVHIENTILLNKMIAILDRKRNSSKSPVIPNLPPDDASCPYTDRGNKSTSLSREGISNCWGKKCSSTTDSEQCRPKQAKLVGSLNLSTRKFQMQKINEENYALLNKLKDTKPTVSVQDWKQQFKQHTKYRKQIQLQPEIMSCSLADQNKEKPKEVHIASKLSGKYETSTSTFFVHRGKKQSTQNADLQHRHITSDTFKEATTLNDDLQNHPIEHYQRTRSVGRGSSNLYGLQLQKQQVQQQYSSEHRKSNVTSQGWRSRVNRLSPKMGQTQTSDEHAERNAIAAGRRLKTSENTLRFRSDQHVINLLEANDGTDETLQALGSLSGNVNEWRGNQVLSHRDAYQYLPQRRFEIPRIKPRIQVTQTSFFDYGGIDYGLPLCYKHDNVCQDLSDVSTQKPDVSVIQKFQSPSKSSHPYDSESNRKRISAIYNNKKNFKGERLFKLSLQSKLRFQTPSQQASNQSCGKQTAQPVKTKVLNHQREISLYESFGKAGAWPSTQDRPCSREESRPEGIAEKAEVDRPKENADGRLKTRGGQRGVDGPKHGQLIAGEFGKDKHQLQTAVNQVDFGSLTYPTEPASQTFGKSPAKSLKNVDFQKLEQDLACKRLAKIFNEHANQKKKLSTQKPEMHANQPNKFVKPKPKHQQKVAEPVIAKVQDEDIEIAQIVAQSSTKSQGSQREQNQRLFEPIRTMQTRTQDASIEHSLQAELLRRDDTPDPINLQINTALNNPFINTSPAHREEEDENAIIIGDSTVEVENSREEFELHPDKQSCFSSIESGVQAIGPSDNLSGVQNLQVEIEQTPMSRVEANIVNHESDEYQFDTEDERLLDEQHQGSEGHLNESEQEVEIVSVDDSYSSDDAKLERIKKPNNAGDGTRWEAQANDPVDNAGIEAEKDDTEYSEEQFD